MSVIAKLLREGYALESGRSATGKKLYRHKPDAVCKKNIAASSLCTCIVSFVSPVHYSLSSRVSNLITVQQDAAYSVYYISVT